MNKYLFNSIKTILLVQPGFCLDGRTVSLSYEEYDNCYHVINIDDNFNVNDKIFQEEEIDEAILYFMKLYDSDRISFTDEEVNV